MEAELNYATTLCGWFQCPLHCRFDIPAVWPDDYREPDQPIIHSERLRSEADAVADMEIQRRNGVAHLGHCLPKGRPQSKLRKYG